MDTETPNAETAAPAPEKKRGLPGWLNLVLRLTVSGLLIGFLLWRVDLQVLWETTTRLRWWHVALFMSINVIVALLNTAKWQVLLRGRGITAPFLTLLRLWWSALFFSNVLPTGVAGDVTRVFSVGQDSGKGPDALATVFYDRAVGLVALLLMGPVALAFSPLFRGNWLFWGFFGLTGAVAVGALIAVSLPLGVWMIDLGARVVPPIVRLRDWVAGLALKPGEWPYLLSALGIAVVVQIFAILGYVVLAAGLQLPIPPAAMFIFVPILYLTILVPISFGGVGVREAMFALFFGQLGIAEAESVSLSLTYYALYLAFSAVGLLLYLAGRRSAADQAGTTEPA